MVRSVRMQFIASSLLLSISVVLLASRESAAQSKETVMRDGSTLSMNRIAEQEVKLALALGEHDPLYVDAYFGPEEWRKEAEEQKKPLAIIEREALSLLTELQGIDASMQEEIVRLRRTFLIKQLESLAARTRMLSGARFTFDEESNALFDIAAPPFDETRFKARLARIDSLLPPGEGTRADRLDRFRKQFMIPKEKISVVFDAAIDEARRRTRQHIPLPEDESFDVEYVTDKSWGAYNWYKGDHHSVIQINTDLPKYIDSPLALACHEGYPGHHVQNVLFEQHLVKERGWVEFTIAPLFSPLSPINEGSADFGVEVAFPGEERLAFERDVLYPLAGIDPARAASYDAVMKLVRDLGSAENEAARRYLNGAITAEEAAGFLGNYALMSPDRARKLVTFMDQYRSYIINYNVGYDLVKNYIEKRGGTEDRPAKRWEEYTALISVPHVPSELK